MTLALGNVIASIGGDGGGGGPVPHRYVHDFGPTPIPAGGALTHVVPDVPEGATMVATLEWDGPETGGFAVALDSGFDAAAGVALSADSGLLPVTVVSTASGPERGLFNFIALAEGYTATRLTVIIIPTINEAT